MSAPVLYDIKHKVRPIEVVVDGSSREDFEYAFKKFKTLFSRERVIGQIKEKEAHEKPSEKKRRKRREAENRKLMNEMRERMIKTGEWDRRQKNKAQRKITKDERSAGFFDE